MWFTCSRPKSLTLFDLEVHLLPICTTRMFYIDNNIIFIVPRDHSLISWTTIWPTCQTARGRLTKSKPLLDAGKLIGIVELRLKETQNRKGHKEAKLRETAKHQHRVEKVIIANTKDKGRQDYLYTGGWLEQDMGKDNEDNHKGASKTDMKENQLSKKSGNKQEKITLQHKN